MSRACFGCFFRDRPEIHPLCNREEIELIESSRPADSLSPHGRARRVPLKRLLQSRSMWLNCIAQMMTNVGWAFLVTWLPRYLKDVHQVPIEERGLLSSIPLAVGFFGMLGGGWFTDYLSRRVGTRWGRALPISLSRFTAMAAYLTCLGNIDPYLATVAFSVVAFSTDFGSPAIWAFNQDVGGRYVGSVLGWGNMWGNLGAFALPPLMNWVVGDGYWNHGFLMCAVAFLISGICALGIDATIPIAPPDEEQ
ncbi:MAG: hypothetical protein KatS3mg105_1572 [Gemmatales bacterium]|nr:MAG: hypothetical protein KatS3mg105_1572 [Gemmatales bacterium]